MSATTVSVPSLLGWVMGRDPDPKNAVGALVSVPSLLGWVMGHVLTGELDAIFYLFQCPLCRDYRDWETDRKSTRLNSSHSAKSRMPSSA